MTEEILSVIDLKKHFTVGHTRWPRRAPITVKAVDGVSFGVREGETLGLVGESGSGKSTVAYTTVGMYRPTSGRLIFRGQELFGEKGRRPQELRKEIQIVFQDPGSSLNPRHTIREILEMPLRVHQKGRNRVERIVHLLSIVDMPPEYMYKYPHTLSGGEKQIVGVARALASDPKLVILDEPTSALDVSVQAKTITLLLRLQRELHLSYLFITHDLSLMRNVASRVAIMYLGRICEVAETAEFFRNPLHPYTQMLLSSIPVISAAEEELKPRKVISTGEIPSPVDLPTGCSFHTRCPFVMDVCRRVDPVMGEGAPGHQVRCHLFTQPRGA
ncbi:MAG: ABC transporter ATP-binding protein [Spirochaetia bacterium]|jgi:peptide/nickel transport system ATP-binding protein